MARRNPFKPHRFPHEIILPAVRWYGRYPLSCRDVRDMLAGRGEAVDTAAVHRRVRKFDPEIRKRAQARHCSWRGLQWHADETYLRVGGLWRYLWRAVDRFGPEDAIRHVARKHLNNRIESDHAALKQRLRPMRGFQTLAEAKAAPAGIETFRTIRRGQFGNCQTGMINEIAFVDNLFPEAA